MHLTETIAAVFNFAVHSHQMFGVWKKNTAAAAAYIFYPHSVLRGFAMVCVLEYRSANNSQSHSLQLFAAIVAAMCVHFPMAHNGVDKKKPSRYVTA